MLTGITDHLIVLFVKGEITLGEVDTFILATTLQNRVEDLQLDLKFSIKPAHAGLKTTYLIK